MSKIFEYQNLLPLEIEELQGKLNIYLPLLEQRGSIGANKLVDVPNDVANPPEGKHRIFQFLTFVFLFVVSVSPSPGAI